MATARTGDHKVTPQSAASADVPTSGVTECATLVVQASVQLELPLSV
jgi:hypothetical protein